MTMTLRRVAAASGAGIVGSEVGIAPFGYVTSMVVTIGLWLVLAPAIGAVSQVTTKKHA
jgi:hypothetical protein